MTLTHDEAVALYYLTGNANYGLCDRIYDELKTYVENFPELEDKIDGLTNKCPVINLSEVLNVLRGE